jgi:hypothetical protein
MTWHNIVILFFMTVSFSGQSYDAPMLIPVNNGLMYVIPDRQENVTFVL